MKQQKCRFVFFGTVPLAIAALEELERVGLTPSLVVAGKDAHDRKKNPIHPPEMRWALERGIPVEQPDKIDNQFVNRLEMEDGWDVFIVASYGKILPQKLLDIPRLGTVNVHPSLLPKLRGPSPIRSAILNDEKETGVSIMLIDKEMDHGPVLSQKAVPISEWPPKGLELDALLAHEGAMLLAEILPQYLAGNVTPQEQDHSQATYTKMFEKEDGHIYIEDDAYQGLLKIRAFEGWPHAFTYFIRGVDRIRVAIVDAHIENSDLILDIVKPEGKGAMTYEDFMRATPPPKPEVREK